MKKNNLIRIIISLVFFIPFFILHFFVDIDNYLMLIFTLIPYFIVGYDILWRSIRNIMRGDFLDENFLMAIATIGAFIIGEHLEAVAVMIFYQIGELFQSYAVNKSRKSISDLMDIRPNKAVLIQDDEEVEVEPEDVCEGDILLIKAGERVPVDGVVIKGKSSLDVKALTGESLPRDVELGDEVLSGSVNIDGVIYIEATKMYFDSTVSKILDLVENVSGKKAKTENFITRFARIYTPIVVVCALLVGIIPPIFLGNWSSWVFRALTFLVVSCPCALVISVPLSFFCGIGGASKDGILVKGGGYLEKIKAANVFIFDKTGTLTKGEFKVIDVISDNYSKEEVLSIAAICEVNSNHPIAVSIMNEVDSVNGEGYEIKEIAGYGMVATGNDVILVGNSKLMAKYNIPCDKNLLKSVVHVAKNNEYIGAILISDEIRKEAKDVIQYLNQQGHKTIMLTGDQKDIALAIAGYLGIKEVKYELLPQDKVKIVEEIIDNKSAEDVVLYVGDGINDAPVLMRSDVGISMGGIGSDSAIEASDVVLMYDNLECIIKAKMIAYKTTRIVMQNIIFALVIKIGVLILSALGFANMWLAILADVGVAVIAILNAMRCSKVKKFN